MQTDSRGWGAIVVKIQAYRLTPRVGLVRAFFDGLVAKAE